METEFSIKEIAMERNLYLDKLIRRKNIWNIQRTALYFKGEYRHK